MIGGKEGVPFPQRVPPRPFLLRRDRDTWQVWGGPPLLTAALPRGCARNVGGAPARSVRFAAEPWGALDVFKWGMSDLSGVFHFLKLGKIYIT